MRISLIIMWILVFIQFLASNFVLDLDIKICNIITILTITYAFIMLIIHFIEIHKFNKKIDAQYQKLREQV